MSDVRAAPARAQWLLPILLGAYAAAIAIAPKPGPALVLAAPLAALPLAWWILQKTNRWLPLFFAAALLLPPLPFAFGNSGPHPAAIFALFGLLAGMLNAGDWSIPDSRLNRAFLVVFLILLASVAEAVFYSGAAVAMGSLARVLLFGISVYVFFYAAYGPGARESARPFAQARLLYWIAVASALFACVDFYFHFPAPAGFGAQFIWLRSGVFRRAQGLFYEASTMGNFCAFFLVMIVAAMTRRGQPAPVSRKALLVGFIIFSIALVLTFSRASLIAVLVAVAVLLYLHRPHIRWGRALIALAIIATVCVVVLRAIFPTFISEYWIRLHATMQYFFSETEGLLSGRLQSWRIVLDFLAEHPWLSLFGIGYKTLPYSTYLGRTVITDNMYLSLIAETGLAGLAAVIWLSVEILRATRRAVRSADGQRSFFGTWMLAFWVAQLVQMFSGDLLTYWRVLPVYFWVLAQAVRNEHSVP